MKQFKYLIILCLLGINEPLAAMKINKEKIKKACKAAGTSIFFGCTLGQTYYAVSKAHTKNKNHLDADPKVTQFVQKTLQEAGYPESFYTSITIKNSKKFESSFNTMFVPLSSEALKWAKALTKKNKYYTSLFKNAKILEEYHKELPNHLPSHVKNTILVRYGIPTDMQSATLWKNIIIHEAAHIAHKDSLTSAFLFALVPFAIHYGTKKAPFLDFLPTKLALYHYLMPFADLCLGKYKEYYADQEIIKRVTDPQALEQQSHFFKNTHEEEQLQTKEQLLALELKKLEIQEAIIDLKNILIKIEQNTQKNSDNTTILYDLKQSTNDMIEESTKLLQKIETKHSKLKNKIARHKKYPFLKEFTQKHPSNEVRSAYFKQAAEELRIKEQK